MKKLLIAAQFGMLATVMPITSNADITLDLGNQVITHTVHVYDETKWKSIVTYKTSTHVKSQVNGDDNTYTEWNQINCAAETHHSSWDANKKPRWDGWQKVNLNTPNESRTQIFKYVCNTPLKEAKPPKEDTSKKEPVKYWKDGDPL
jgi:hypothetical protein